MSEVSMGHLTFLDAIAKNDVAFINMREATYKGSWKAEGGRSAWFNLKRKIDRLLNMLRATPLPVGLLDRADVVDKTRKLSEQTYSFEDHKLLVKYAKAEDIFLAIRTDPSGKDGSPLAEVRDLRRYLLLVEAEMINQGVIGVDVVGAGHG